MLLKKPIKDNMYNKNEIIACVVTYNFDSQLYGNIMSYIHQVNEVVIIDNNSCNKKLLIDLFSNTNKINIIYNNENYGIAKALNQAFEIALDKNYKFLLTMDQDSLLKEDCVEKLYNAITLDGYTSAGANFSGKDFKKKYINSETLITSGNLVSLAALKEINGFYDDLFIDGVDFDVSLKLRENGGKLAIVNDAIMKHSLGERKKIKFLCFSFFITQHSLSRYYYIGRNYKYLSKRFKRFKRFRIIKWVKALKHNLILFFFHDDAIKKFKEMSKGKKDARFLLK